MTLRSILSSARYLVLAVPAFAFLSTLQAGCTSGGSAKDDYAHEDPHAGAPNGGYGYGSGSGYGSYDDGDDTYGYE